MIRLVLFLVTLSGPALATQDAWPALFYVSGVDIDDVLNVRATPDVTAPVIATLSHDAKDVEVIAPNDSQSWGRVNTGETSGWVSLAYLRRQPGQWLGARPAIRRCGGAEPFWSLSLGGSDSVSFVEPAAPVRTGQVEKHWTSENRRDRHGFSAGFGDDHDLLAIVEMAECSDGSSDRINGLSVDIVIGGPTGGRMLSGCCSLAP